VLSYRYLLQLTNRGGISIFVITVVILLASIILDASPITKSIGAYKERLILVSSSRP